VILGSRRSSFRRSGLAEGPGFRASGLAGGPGFGRLPGQRGGSRPEGSYLGREGGHQPADGDLRRAVPGYVGHRRVCGYRRPQPPSAGVRRTRGAATSQRASAGLAGRSPVSGRPLDSRGGWRTPQGRAVVEAGTCPNHMRATSASFPVGRSRQGSSMVPRRTRPSFTVMVTTGAGSLQRPGIPGPRPSWRQHASCEFRTCSVATATRPASVLASVGQVPDSAGYEPGSTR
jgi:hypothetical protein